MCTYKVVGGSRLEGRLKVEGSKNAVLPIMVATILNEGESIIENVPALKDVETMLEILGSLGCRIEYKNSTVWIDASNISSNEIPEALVRQMRSSIVLLGSLLGRTGKVVSTYPGGCAIGVRPIDLHLKGLKMLGAKVQLHGQIVCEGEKLQGTNIQLDYPSVGATENIMLAAVKAKGTTIIRNAAREPEIADLQGFLNSMGAKIWGAGSQIIKIVGVEKLHSTKYRVIADRITAGTYMAAVAVTGGRLELDEVIIEHLHPVVDKFKESGCVFRARGNTLKMKAPKRLKAVDTVRTLPYPGYPTDMQAQFMAMMCVARGTSFFIENIFENRYRHVDQLVKMGADIKVDGRTAVIRGVKELTGTSVTAEDLRGGASLVIAGLAAQGTTIVEGVEHIYRGYENFNIKLNKLGANIEKV